MKPAPFDYYCPRSLDEALALLAQYGDEAKVLAGGQSLVPAMNMRLARPGVIVDVNRLPEAAVIERCDGSLRVGMLARKADLERMPVALDAVHLLAQALPHVGHWQTRNRGTVCGSLAHADPSAELPLAIVVLDGAIEARSSARGTRWIAAGQFFESYFQTALQNDEIVVGASFPARREGWGYAFEEFAGRHGDFAIVAVACAVALEPNGVASEVRLGLGGVADKPHLAPLTAYCGRVLSQRDLPEIANAAVADIEPPSDLRGSARYRRALATNLAQRALTRALASARTACDGLAQ